MLDKSNALEGTSTTPRRLTAEDRRELDSRGYVVIENALSSEQVRGLRARVDELTAAEGLSAGAVDQTPLQLQVNRDDLGPAERLMALGYNAVFRAVHGVARAGLFRWRPELQLALAGRAGSPGFATPRRGVRPRASATRWGRIADEVREMLAAAAYTDGGAIRLADLVNKGPQFLDCLRVEPVLEAVRHVIGPQVRLSSLNYRAARPGGGLQVLHVDWDEAVPPGTFHACNCIFMLDDFEQSNGATRVVPETHLLGTRPLDALPDPLADHPDQIVVSAPAGSALVLNAHVWHGGTKNHTRHLRRALQCYLVRAGFPTQLAQRDYLRPETADRLTPELEVLLGL